MKNCKKCNTLKPIDSFGINKKAKDGLRSYCNKCQTESTDRYYKTKIGLVSRIYSSQKTNSKLKNNPKPLYTKEQLQIWLFLQPLFHKLYDNWVMSGYEKDLKPSVDRKDDYKPYTLDNIQLMIWKDNRLKGFSDKINGVNRKQLKAVVQYSLALDYINEFHSQAEAERQTGINQGHISDVCNGKRITAGNHIWRHM